MSMNTNNRLMRNAAVAIADQCLKGISPALHESLHKQAWECLYEIAEREIYLYEVNVNRMRQRLRPLGEG
jgi:hypothetical protein